MTDRLLFLIAAGGLFAAFPAIAQSGVTERSVAAHEAFLASDAMQGRGSATRDEAIAAAYVASEFQSYGLTAAPGLGAYLQTAPVVRETLARPAALTAPGLAPITPTIVFGSGETASGVLTVSTSADPAAWPTGGVVLVDAPGDPQALLPAASAKHLKLLMLAESDMTRRLVTMTGGKPRLPIYPDGAPPTRPRPTIAIVPAERIADLAKADGRVVTLDVEVNRERSTTTNAIGYLRGDDPAAGTLLLTAHLDHLGTLADGTIMHGANDDASGVTAVLELAQALAAGARPRRSILFVCYGSEEIGDLGSRYFGAHPPVPLDQIIANIEFEMIGAQDPKLPPNTLMMTGFDRSNLGPALKEHGALLADDPYPEQHFFQRSDNYALALKGVVAHTVSGWATTPTYHQPTDTIANLNAPFMTRAIGSLVAPIAWLANGDFVPTWTAGGKPTAEH